MKKSRRNNALQILCTVSLFALAVGIMTWRDLHPPARKADAPIYSTAWLVGENAAAADIPNDSTAIVLRQGDIDLTPGGLPVYRHKGLEPMNFPQRQADLLYRIDRLPDDPAALVAEIRSAMAPWTALDNTVLNIYLDVDKPDWKALTALAAVLKPGLGHSYSIDVMTGESWLATAQADRTDLLNLQKNVSLIVVRPEAPLKDAAAAASLITRADAAGVPFMIVVPHAKDIDALMPRLKGTKEFVGFMKELEHDR